MKKLLLGLLAVCFLGGCSTQEEPEDVTYDWTPPFEDVSLDRLQLTRQKN
ncbi:hypothetical protein HQ870_11215 [Enterococcus faecium]|nr:hypothetical protein [Enterococcus faecium]MCU4679172.1 hypothetical protein [Enterococcus faecium]MDT2332764.1 hypothetical protein [Enterococcus faecium]MDT2362958.1 hypothetical protein [Enterococcus faecium]MDV7755937.1 hypothetical protein [Enterococcus faecium]NTQ27760.1 hypothetical protein [Enterococcus faecium]